MYANITKYSAFLGLFLLSACFSPPNFPDAPEIEFESISIIRTVDPLGNTQDSITVTIGFRDGDGDLGLAAYDTLPPYQAFTTDDAGNKVLNYFHHNYHMKVKRIENGVEEDVAFLDNGSVKGRFPMLVSGKGPIEGELNFGRYFLINGSSNTFNTGDSLFFEVEIADRALNISNSVQSSVVVLGD